MPSYFERALQDKAEAERDRAEAERIKAQRIEQKLTDRHRKLAPAIGKFTAAREERAAVQDSLNQIWQRAGGETKNDFAGILDKAGKHFGVKGIAELGGGYVGYAHPPMIGVKLGELEGSERGHGMMLIAEAVNNRFSIVQMAGIEYEEISKDEFVVASGKGLGQLIVVPYAGNQATHAFQRGGRRRLLKPVDRFDVSLPAIDDGSVRSMRREINNRERYLSRSFDPELPALIEAMDAVLPRPVQDAPSV